VVPARQYAQWLATKADHGVAYRYHRRLLQHLQHRFRAERWALKAPGHMFHLQALLDEYPDAQIVVTHRDLTKVLPSIASMATAFHRIFVVDTAVDPVAVGRNVVSLLSQGVRHTMEVREQLGRPAQFCDVLYSDLRGDPVKAVERIYSKFEIPLTTRARDAMSRYVESEGKARHGHGRHRYALADYEFSEPDIDREFRPYIDAYRVMREP